MLPFSIHKLIALAKFARTGALIDTGWFYSYHLNLPVDKNLNPVPWYSYSAMSFIDQRLKSNFRIFEYGTGYSTLYFAKRVSSVVSVEHDQLWASKIRKQLPINVTLIHRDLSDGYVDESLSHGLFDIIAIDGRDRVKCSQIAEKSLNETGIIIWDNTERERYLPGINGLLLKGFRQIDFVGLIPIGTNLTTTSIFYRDNNCFNI
jgi:hypothetical protein